MNDRQSRRFDTLVEEALENLPDRLRQLLDEFPLIVMDRPTRAMLKDLGLDGPAAPGDPDPAEEICGLHTGTAITEKSIERSGELPTQIHLFREGIVATAGGWGQPRADDEVYAEIVVTLLHEIGHHFGLDEDDLADLGYD